MNEVLTVKTKKGSLHFKVYDKRKGRFNRSKYEQIISNRDYNHLALLFHDLHVMGYPIDKAHAKFRQMIGDPTLFFLS